MMFEVVTNIIWTDGFRRCRDGISEMYDIDAANEKEAAKIAEKSFIKKYGKNLLKKCKVSRK